MGFDQFIAPPILKPNFLAINSQQKHNLLPRQPSASFLSAPMHLFQRSSALQLFLCMHAYYIVIIFMHVSLLALLTLPKAGVLSFNLCITSKLKSMLCSQYTFTNHLLDEWTNEPQNILHLMPRKCSVWNGDMRWVLPQCLVIEVRQSTDKTGIRDGLRWQKMAEVGSSYLNFSIKESGRFFIFLFLIHHLTSFS